MTMTMTTALEHSSGLEGPVAVRLNSLSVRCRCRCAFRGCRPQVNLEMQPARQ